MSETKRVYLERINFILDFIENNLDTNLSLDYLAQKAHYSAYHFHRVFLTVVNERLNEFIHRKRIERIASILLVEPDVALNDLIYQYGFNSDSSFSRSFKKYYGVSPTKFRTEGKNILSKIGIVPFSPEKYICSIENTKQWINMKAQITIQELPVLQLAAISHIGEFDKIGDMFQQLMEWGHQKNVLDTSNFKAITLYHDNPHVTETSKLRYSAGVTIRENIKAEREVRQMTIEQGLYVVGHFEVQGEEIARAWKSMCIWVVENEYEFRDGSFFEVYLNDYRTHPEQKFILDICMPLERTKNIKRGEIGHINLPDKEDEQKPNYHQLIGYMKELSAFFQKEYGTRFRLGKIYKENPDYSYFSLTTEELKQQKLKFVIILDHQTRSFSICLSGQNKSIRKKYWQVFKESDWDKYHLAESIDNSLSIVDQTIVRGADFKDKGSLTDCIDREVMEFIQELCDILD